MKSLFFCVWLITLVLSQAEIDPMADEIVEEPLIADPEPEVTAQNNPPINARKFEFNKETAYLYRYELVAVAAIFFYLIMYRTGRSQNSHIIEQFYRQTRAYIQDNFAHIGFTKNSGEDPFVAESASDAMFYASGRQNVDYLEIAFNVRDGGFR